MEQDIKSQGADMLAHAEPEAQSARPPDPDIAILQAVAAGDLRKAIGLCAASHGASIGRLCMALVGSQAEAQELAQETLLVAYSALPSYRAEGSLRAFLFGIARRVCSRHIEVKVRRENKLRLVVPVDGVSVDASELLALQQRATQARVALEALRPSERDAVVLRFSGGLSFREVAEACGIDEATARKRVSRAIARLRETFGDS